MYILINKKRNKTYVGITNNLARRLKEHNEGKSLYTSRFGPWNVIYVEYFKKRSEARSREKYFKSAAGRRKMKKNIVGPASRRRATRVEAGGRSSAWLERRPVTAMAGSEKILEKS